MTRLRVDHGLIVLYAARVAHMPRDPTPVAIHKEADCPECGKVTTHEWIQYPAEPSRVSRRRFWLVSYFDQTARFGTLSSRVLSFVLGGRDAAE